MNKMNEMSTLPSKYSKIIFSTLPEAEGASVEAKATKTMDKARCGFCSFKPVM